MRRKGDVKKQFATDFVQSILRKSMEGPRRPFKYTGLTSLQVVHHFENRAAIVAALAQIGFKTSGNSAFLDSVCERMDAIKELERTRRIFQASKQRDNLQPLLKALRAEQKRLKEILARNRISASLFLRIFRRNIKELEREIIRAQASHGFD